MLGIGNLSGGKPLANHTGKNIMYDIRKGNINFISSFYECHNLTYLILRVNFSLATI